MNLFLWALITDVLNWTNYWPKKDKLWPQELDLKCSGVYSLLAFVQSWWGIFIRGGKLKRHKSEGAGGLWALDLHDGQRHEGHFKTDFLHSPSLNGKRSLTDVREFPDYGGKQKFQVECYPQNLPLEPWHSPSLLRVTHIMMALQHEREVFNSLLVKLKLFDKWDTYHQFIRQCNLKLWSLTESNCKAFAFALCIYIHT